MAKDYIEQREAKAAPKRGAGKGVKSGEDFRRSQPRDAGPYSPAFIDDFYKSKNERIASNLNTDGGGDGLVDRTQHAFDVKIQRPQFPEDQHLPDYHNDTKDGWLRGSGLRGATAKPDFDHVGRKTLRQAPSRGDGELVGMRNATKAVTDNGSKPAGGPRNEATGQDYGGTKGFNKASPFSAAHFKGRGEG